MIGQMHVTECHNKLSIALINYSIDWCGFACTVMHQVI